MIVWRGDGRLRFWLGNRGNVDGFAAGYFVLNGGGGWLQNKLPGFKPGFDWPVSLDSRQDVAQPHADDLVFFLLRSQLFKEKVVWEVNQFPKFVGTISEEAVEIQGQRVSLEDVDHVHVQWDRVFMDVAGIHLVQHDLPFGEHQLFWVLNIEVEIPGPGHHGLKSNHTAGSDVSRGWFNADDTGDVVNQLTQDGAVCLSVVVAEPVGVFSKRPPHINHVGVFASDFGVDEDLIHTGVTPVGDLVLGMTCDR